MEKACVDTIDNGKMTKDLAGCIHGLKKYDHRSPQRSCLTTLLSSIVYSILFLFDFCSVKPEHYLNTMEFLEAINEEFQRQW